MKPLLTLLLMLGTLQGAHAAAPTTPPGKAPEACADTFYGTVNYDDITDEGQRVVRQEKFRFKSWSPEEQFDEILFKTGPEIPDGSGVQVRVIFSTPPDPGSKMKIADVIRVAGAGPWLADQKFFIVADLNIKHLVRHEAPKANRFTITAEKDGRVLCTRAYRISRGD